MTKNSAEDYMRKLDQEEMIRQLADEWCGSDEQAAAFVHTVGRELEWTGVRLMWVRPDGTKTVALNDDNFKEHVKDKFGFLLKPERVVPEGTLPGVELDPATVASALSGNMTARGALAKAFGNGDGDKGAAAADLYLQAQRVSGSAAPAAREPLYNGRTNGGGDNPFGSSWSKTRQGQILKSDPGQAARLCKLAGFDSLDDALRATKPRA